MKLRLTHACDVSLRNSCDQGHFNRAVIYNIKRLLREMHAVRPFLICFFSTFFCNRSFLLVWWLRIYIFHLILNHIFERSNFVILNTFFELVDLIMLLVLVKFPWDANTWLALVLGHYRIFTVLDFEVICIIRVLETIIFCRNHLVLHIIVSMKRLNWLLLSAIDFRNFI